MRFFWFGRFNIWLARAIGTVAVARKQVTRAIELDIGLGFL
ncbi:hypothetical protein [Bradyrhizobium sp. sBnM-33]|nr:hypothetical protein [Bradyrhizobium sp. sBnM-33]